MRNRIFSGWNFQRILFTVMGSMVVIQSVLDKQWWGVLFGVYFAAMGLFSFGCAAGGCYSDKLNSGQEAAIKNDLSETEYKEVK